MSYEINYFAWNNTDGHDKVWGYVTVGAEEDGSGGQLYNFWGRRGAKLAFKEHGSSTPIKGGQRWWAYEQESSGTSALKKLQRQKEDKGYKPVKVTDIETICGEGYIDSFENQLVLAKLFEKFRGRKKEDY